MANLQGLRRRLRAVKSTRQITRAMKMVSSAKLRRSQERVTAARPYTTKMLQIFNDVATRASEYRHPLLASKSESETEETGSILLVLITGDKGLCGPFNTNLAKTAQEFLRNHSGEAIEMVLVGRKGMDYFKRRPVTIRRSYPGITGTGRVKHEDALRIAREVIEDFTAEGSEFQEVYIIYSEFKSALSLKTVTEKLLPIGNEPAPTAPQESTVDYIYEQPPNEIFGTLLPKLVEAQVYRALLESVASENGARMTAMESASKNADEVITKLTLNMNRVRQAAITREIIEVVSGASVK